MARRPRLTSTPLEMPPEERDTGTSAGWLSTLGLGAAARSAPGSRSDLGSRLGLASRSQLGSSTGDGEEVPYDGPVTEDFVFAIYTTPARMPLVRAGRAWRKGCRTVVASNEALPETLQSEAERHNETWLVLPDNTREQSKTPADFRGALLPGAAHRLLKGGYKWMLWADDDTMWFPPGALRLLRRWDHTLVHAITDNFWPENMRIPMWVAVRCLPCDSNPRPGDTASEGVLTTADNFTAPLACPVCTAKTLCDNLGAFGWQYGEWIELQGEGMCDREPIPWPENEAFSAHGGTGVAISVGAATLIAATDEFEQCVHDPDGWMKEGGYLGGERWNSGGDGIFTRCLWTAGYGVTDTGTALEGPHQRVDRLEYWAFNATNKRDFMQFSEYDRTWRRRERKRLFGGTGQGSGNLRELQDMLAQWPGPDATDGSGGGGGARSDGGSDGVETPADECLGDVFCLAELERVQRLVSSHAGAKYSSDLRSHGRSLRRLFRSHQRLLLRLGWLQPPLPERPPAPGSPLLGIAAAEASSVDGTA